MEQKALRGLSWTLLSYAGNRGVTLLVTVVLARLLVPEDFGLVSLALLAIGFMSLLNDLGLGGTFVVRQDLDRGAQRTMFSLLIGMNTLAGCLVIASAPLMASLFQEPRLMWVLIGLSPTVFLSGFSRFYEALLQRELEFKRSFTCRMLQGMAFGAVAVTLAVLGFGVWSIVAGQGVSWLVYTAALMTLSPYRLRPGFERRIARSLMGGGMGFLAQGALAFVRQNIDYLAVGRVLGAAPLGFYSIAYRLAELSYWAIADPVARVTFPGFARMRSRGEDVRPSFLSALRLVALVACPFGALLSGPAQPLVVAVFGVKWLPSVGCLAVLGIWAAMRPIETTLGWLLNSVGRAGTLARISGVLLIPEIPALFVAASYGGIIAVSWVMLAGSVVSAMLISVAAQRVVGVSVMSSWRAIQPAVVGGAAAWLVSRGVTIVTEDLGAWPSLSLAVVAGGASYLAATSIAEPGVFGATLSQIRRTIRPPSTTPSS